MGARRQWSALSEPYRARLARKGITQVAYESGISLSSARGHAQTPERPIRAFREPERYPTYIRRRVIKGKPVPEETLAKLRPGGAPIAESLEAIKPTVGAELGWSGRDGLQHITFFRSRWGSRNKQEGTMMVTTYGLDGSIANVHTYQYNQGDFYRLVRLARQQGFRVSVESTGQSLIA